MLNTQTLKDYCKDNSVCHCRLNDIYSPRNRMAYISIILTTDCYITTNLTISHSIFFSLRCLSQVFQVLCFMASLAPDQVSIAVDVLSDRLSSSPVMARSRCRCMCLRVRSLYFLAVCSMMAEITHCSLAEGAVPQLFTLELFTSWRKARESLLSVHWGMVS